MRIVIFGGGGRIGSAVAWDLVRDGEVEQVGLVGRREGSLRRAQDWIGSGKLRLHVHDVSQKEETKRLMDQYDVGVIALPNRRTSYGTLETAIDSGLNVLDLLEEYHRRPDPYETEGLKVPPGMSLKEYGDSLHRRAQESDITLLDGMGFAPGVSNATLGEGIRKLDLARTATARVGGIPSKESSLRHPLRYMITWSLAHALREYMIKVRVIRGGKLVEVDATTDRESFRFSAFGKDEQLECAVTPGMPSLLYTRSQLQEFSEKTVRWPGHWEGIDLLKECGLLDLNPVEFEEAKIRPRDFFVYLVEPRLRPLPGDEDICLMWNSVMGEKDGQERRMDYYMWAEADPDTGMTAMARVTGFSAAIGARLLGRGEIKEKGIVAPEDGIEGDVYQKFMEELKRKGIEALETQS